MASIFFANNASDKWIVAVDDKAICCDSREQALDLYGLVGCIEESPFGCMILLAPQSVARQRNGAVADTDISEITTRVNPDYIAKRISRAGLACRMPGPPIPASERFAREKEWNRFFTETFGAESFQAPN